MKHLPFDITPVSRIKSYSNELGCNILCKRDDLFMEACGGNKARMLQYILYELNKTQYDVVVTAGPKSSNFNRACALMCAKMGIPLHLIVYSSDETNDEKSLNYKMCSLSNVIITLSPKNKVSDTIKNVISNYKDKRVLSIYGGGRSIEGVYAYYDAIEELYNQLQDIDHLFVACGTGTTLTGICAGMQKWFPNAIVHGISISRKCDDEMKILEEDMFWLNDYLGTSYNFSNLHFTDEYLSGGYGVFNEEIRLTINDVISREGLILDPCYSGKAWNGMMKIITCNKSDYQNKNILYWHTGGLFNLLSLI